MARRKSPAQLEREIRESLASRGREKPPLISPAYDLGQSETHVSAGWRRYWENLWSRRADSTPR